MNHDASPVNHDQRSDRSRGGVVIYFMGTDDEQHIKFGKTRQLVAARRSQHERGLLGTNRLHFLASVQGVDSDENAVKRYFAPYTANGKKEVLRAEAAVVDYVRWLTHQWFVARSEADAWSYERVSSEHWLPTPDRTIPPPARLTFGTWGCLTDPDITGDDYYTDRQIIYAARAVMGGIDLDPASHPAANREIRARRIYTFSDDGLRWPWAGRIWLNPPFGQWSAWGPKVVDEWRSGRVEQMCVLAATRTLTAHSVSGMLGASTGLCILHGRIPFWGPKAGPAPDDGHAILYFGRDFAGFADEFSTLGNTLILSVAHRERVA